MATSNLKRKIISAVTSAAIFATSATVTVFTSNAADTKEAAANFTLSAVSSELADRKELERLYIEEIFYGDFASPYKDYGSKNLSGMQLEIYNFLREKIEAVAAGTVTKTQFTFTASKGYDDYKVFGEDIKKAVRCLLVDLPQSFYWFDKTTGYGMSFSGQSDYNKAVVTFAVSNDYAAANSEVVTASGKNYKVDVDPAKMNAARTAAAAAEKIAAKYTDKTVSEKIKGYRDEICELVSYNTDAAANSSTPYGDPWQLVYVFDGDPDTNVVCEGYSKAFQYLCDLGGIDCYTVTGTMQGGTGAGPHMWNIVVLDDNYLVDITNCDTGSIGADDKLLLKGASVSDEEHCVFNNLNKLTYTYDKETIALYGAVNILKVATVDYDPSKDHQHTASDEWVSDKTGHWHVCSECGEKVGFAAHEKGAAKKENVKEATCTEEGSYEEVICCKVCEYEMSRTEKTVEKLPHTPDKVVKENEKDATCTEAGSYDEVIYCAVCKTELERKTVTGEKLPHDPDAPAEKNTVEATCTKNGSYDEVTVCKVCGEVIKTEHKIIPAVGHDFSADWSTDTESHWQECTRCGEKAGLTAHVENKGTVTKTPAADEDGERTYYCAVCGEALRTEVIPALGEDHVHDYTILNCDENGHWNECVCGETDPDSAVETHTSEIKEETAFEPTCNVDGFKYVIKYCSVCGFEIERTSETIEKTEIHTPGDKYFSDTENHWKICTVCEAAVDSEAHKEGEAVKENEKAATCTEEGSYEEVIYCEACEFEMSRTPKTSEKIAHSFTDYVSDKNATCTEDGTKTAKCDNCEAEDTVKDEGSATGHDYGEWEITVKPTLTTGGTALRVCKNDKTHSERVELPVLTDTSVWTEGNRVEPTESSDGYQEYTSEYGTVTVVLPKTGNGGSTVVPPYSGSGNFADPDTETTTEAATESATEAADETSVSADINVSDTSAVNEPEPSVSDTAPAETDTTALPGIEDNGTGTSAVVNAEIKMSGDELMSSVLTNEELEQAANGASVSVALSVTTDEAVPEADKVKVNEALNGYSIGQYLNINLIKSVNGVETQVTAANAPITIVVNVPDGLVKSGRTFAVIRVHEGEAEFLPDTDNDPLTITIESDRFSTYAIVYTDSSADKNDNPNTGDSFNTAAFVGIIGAEMIMSVMIFIAMMKVGRKKKASNA